MLRIRAAPTRVAGPNAPLRLVERVRDGLRNVGAGPVARTAGPGAGSGAGRHLGPDRRARSRLSKHRTEPPDGRVGSEPHVAAGLRADRRTVDRSAGLVATAGRAGRRTGLRRVVPDRAQCAAGGGDGSGRPGGPGHRGSSGRRAQSRPGHAAAVDAGPVPEPLGGFRPVRAGQRRHHLVGAALGGDPAPPAAPDRRRDHHRAAGRPPGHPAGGGGDLGSGQCVGTDRQCAGRSLRRSGDGAGVRRGRQFLDQPGAGRGVRVGRGRLRSIDHLGGPRRRGPARIVLAVAD